MARNFGFPCLLALAAFSGAALASELKPAQIKEARKLYVAKCAKCHRLYEPKDYDDAAWQTWMDKMARKAKLKTNQEAILNQYLDEYRAGKISVPQ